MANSTPTMRVVSFYHRETGMFNGRHLMVSDPAMIPLNTPPDHIAIEGDHYDPLTQRVDIATGKVIDHLPPQPSPDHEWSAISRRWQLRPEVTAKQQARTAALGAHHGTGAQGAAGTARTRAGQAGRPGAVEGDRYADHRAARHPDGLAAGGPWPASAGQRRRSVVVSQRAPHDQQHDRCQHRTGNLPR
jgi:hypothetical protein